MPFGPGIVRCDDVIFKFPNPVYPIPMKRYLVVLPLSALLFESASAEDQAQLPHAFEAGWKGAQTCELLYETDAVRVGKCVFAPGIGHEKHYHNPHFGYTLEGSTLKITDDSGEREVVIPTGLAWSTDSLTVHEAVNVGDSTTSYLIVEPKP